LVGGDCNRSARKWLCGQTEFDQSCCSRLLMVSSMAPGCIVSTSCVRAESSVDANSTTALSCLLRVRPTYSPAADAGPYERAIGRLTWHVVDGRGVPEVQV
jgi:hypothetical protein